MTEHKIVVHEKWFDIAWGDMDALGHVNNARYLDYFQEARIEWLRTLDINLREQHGPVVIHVACTYLKPVVYPARLLLRSAIHGLGRSSFNMSYDLFQNEVLMSQGSCKIVWVDYKLNQSIKVPETIRALFSQ